MSIAVRLGEGRVVEASPAGHTIEILPDGFPERYREAVVRAAGLCSMKKHIERGPHIDVAATRSSGTAG